MEEHEEKGRAQVRSVIRVSIGIALIVLVGFGLLKGLPGAMGQSIRLVVTLLLCWSLSKRLAWAHWVAGAAFALAGLGSLLGGLVSLAAGSMAGLGVIGIALAYAYCAATLLLSRDVAAYMTREPDQTVLAEPQADREPARESANES